MNISEWKKIRSVLQSLKDRTDMFVGLRNESYEISGRNKIYSSRRGIEIDEGHGVPHLVELPDGVFITPLGKKPLCSESYIEEIVPSVLLDGIFRGADIPLPEWVRNKLIKVYIPDYFSGYDDEGKPIFMACPSIEFENGVGFNIQPEEENEEVSDSEEEPDISI